MSDSRFPTFRLLFRLFGRIYRWIFSWRTIRRVLISIGLLLTLVALVWTEENVRGKWAWNRYKSQLEARGEKLELADFVPPKVPDDQNFAMTPLLAGLYDFVPDAARKPGQSVFRDTNAQNRASLLRWSGNISNPIPNAATGVWTNGSPLEINAWASYFKGAKNSASSLTRKEAAQEVLRGLNQFQPQMDELERARQRPTCRFNIDYEAENPTQILLPHLATLKGDAIVFQVRADAELALGKTTEALSDVEMMIYLADALKQEPFEISHLVRIAILELALESIWEGLSEHKWSDKQLVELQSRLNTLDILSDYRSVLASERAWAIKGIEFLRKHWKVDTYTGEERPVPLIMPSGWYHQNKVTVARIITDRFLPYIDTTNHHIWPDKIPTLQILGREAGRFFPFQGLALIFLGLPWPDSDAFPVKFALAHTKVNQAVIACALERYRLKNSHYPESLNALTPNFLQTIPNDVIGGKPLIYRLKDERHFILYSIGWNEKDDGGTIGSSIGDDGKNHYDIKKGDWVWPEYPAE